MTVLRFSSLKITKSVLGFCWLYLEQGMALGEWKGTQGDIATFLTFCVYFKIKILNTSSPFKNIFTFLYGLVNL